MSSTTTMTPPTAMFDMSKMERRSSTCSTIPMMDDSSWGEISVESVISNSRASLMSGSNRSGSSKASASTLSCLSRPQQFDMMDQSSWGELDLDELDYLDESFDDSRQAAEEPLTMRHTTHVASHHRRRTSSRKKKAPPRRSRTAPRSLMRDLSCLSLGASSSKQQQRRLISEDDEDADNELANCLKSLYYGDSKSSKKHFRNAPHLKRHETY